MFWQSFLYLLVSLQPDTPRYLQALYPVEDNYQLIIELETGKVRHNVLYLSSLTFLPTVHKLSSIHSFCCDKQFFALPILVSISKRHSSKWSTSSRIMDYILYYTLRNKHVLMYMYTYSSLYYNKST